MHKTPKKSRFGAVMACFGNSFVVATSLISSIVVKGEEKLGVICNQTHKNDVDKKNKRNWFVVALAFRGGKLKE
jgi:hypothetical protein